MANPPDNNDDHKNLKTDRNLAQPQGIRPPQSATSETSGQQPDKPVEPVDSTRQPRTENLAVKKQSNTPPPVPKATKPPAASPAAKPAVPAQTKKPASPPDLPRTATKTADTSAKPGVKPAEVPPTAKPPVRSTPATAKPVVDAPKPQAKAPDVTATSAAPKRTAAPTEPRRTSRLQRPTGAADTPARPALRREHQEKTRLGSNTPTRQRAARSLTRPESGNLRRPDPTGSETRSRLTRPPEASRPTDTRRPAVPPANTGESPRRTPLTRPSADDRSAPGRPGATKPAATAAKAAPATTTQASAPRVPATPAPETRAPAAEKSPQAAPVPTDDAAKERGRGTAPSGPLDRPQSADRTAPPPRRVNRDGKVLPERAGPPPGHPDRRRPVAQAGTILPASDTAIDTGFAADRPARAATPRRRMRPPVGAKPVGRYLNRPARTAAPVYHTDASTGGSWGPLLLGLLLLAVVGWLAVRHYTPTIQEDLLERSRASLDNAGVAGTTNVSIDGRNITISGNVNSDADSQRAEEAVAATFGVRSVTNELSIGGTADATTLAERQTSSLSFSSSDNGITLSGEVSDQRFADTLNAAVSEQFDGVQIDNQITVNDNATNPGWTAAVAQLLPELNRVENAAIDISGDTVTLSGKTDDAQLAAGIGESADGLLGAQLNVVNNIEAPQPAAPSLPAFASVTETDTQVTLNGFMSAEGAAVIADAYQASGKEVINNISTNDLAETPAWVESFNSALSAMQGAQDGKLTIARSGNVKLQGTVESEEQKQTIGDNVASLFDADTGVSNDLVVVTPPVVPTMTPFASISHSEESITVSGLLPENAAQSLLDSVSNTDKSVINRITVDERVMEPAWTDALGQAAGRLGSIDDGSISVASNGTLTIKGDAKTDQAKQFAGINLGTLFGNAVELQNEITVTPPPPVAPPPVVPSLPAFMSIKQTEQNVVVSGLLPPAAAEEVLAALADSGTDINSNITIDERVIAPAWTTAMGQSLDRLGSVENGAINIASDGTLSLRGEVDTEQARQFAGINFGTLFGDSVSLRNDLTVKTPTIVEPPKPDVQALLAELDLSSIRFRSGSSELDGNSVDILNEVAEVLSLADDARILIAGHTDSRGNADLNFSLSAERAAAVQQYLINRGIAADRLTAQGFGPNQPIATNDTAAGRALNRRIEIQLIGE